MIRPALLALMLVSLALGIAGCESNPTYASDRTPRRSMTTDPFGGARLMTGTDFREARSNDPEHKDDFFKIPARE